MVLPQLLVLVQHHTGALQSIAIFVSIYRHTGHSLQIEVISRDVAALLDQLIAVPTATIILTGLGLLGDVSGEW